MNNAFQLTHGIDDIADIRTTIHDLFVLLKITT